MRYFKVVMMMSALLALLVLAIPACNSTEQTADGDQVADGDGASFDTCTSNNDCPTGTSCLLVGTEYICVPPCTGNADCQPNGCCQQMGTGFFCAPLYACGAVDGDAVPDGDTVDGDVADGDEPACEMDQYRCSEKEENTIERCGADGTWGKYKSCGGGSCCYEGNCVSAQGSDVQCEGAVGFCIADTYRCRGGDEIQKCRGDGTDWEFYRLCEGEDICIDGECISVTDGDVPVDGDVDGDVEEEAEEVCEKPCTSMEEGCVDDNRYCFKEKQTDEEGCCLLFCDIDGAQRCPSGFSCQSGVCQPVEGYCRSDADCEWDKEFCYKRPGASDGICEEYCFNDGQWCPSNAKCEQNQDEANYGKCVYEECTKCTFDQQCVGEFGPGFYCNIWLGQAEGCCIEMCGSTNPCKGGLTCCDDGRCGANCGLETCTKTCPAGYRCDPLYDDCALNCPPCGPNECCDAASAPNCYTCECNNPLICGVLLKPCCFGYNCSAIVYGVLGFCI